MTEFVRSELLQTLPGVAHGFFGRQGGVSKGIYASLNCGPGSGDDPVAVLENRKRATEAIGAGALNTLYQIHSATVVTVEVVWTRETAPQADGMATKTENLALGILAADCAPVLFADTEARVIGACHAGWKGAFGGVVGATVSTMVDLGARRDRIVAAIGPCIAQDAYEVGPEFFDRFVLSDPALEQFFVPSDRPAHWRFDLGGFVGAQLESADVTQFDLLDKCTYVDADTYFSYRRTTHAGEPDYGRNLSLIVLT